MATQYSTIFKKFSDNVSEEDAGKIELSAKRQHLRNAVSIYIATIEKITPNHLEGYIAEDLDEIQMLLISLLMYNSYLDQEIIKYNKVINISSEFMQMSGASLRVKTLKDIRKDNDSKISSILSGMI